MTAVQEMTAEITELTKEVSVKISEFENIQGKFLRDFPDLSEVKDLPSFHPEKIALMEEGLKCVVSLSPIIENMEELTPRVQRIMEILISFPSDLDERTEKAVHDAVSVINRADGVKIFINTTIKSVGKPTLREMGM